MGKKKEEKDELAADFFGNADWMDDDEEEDDDSSEEAHLPVAPSPDVTSEVAAPEAKAAPSDPAGWENKISDAPLDPQALSNAPTLHFSSVPTIPPVDEAVTDVNDAAEDMPTMSADLPKPGAPTTDLGTATDAEETEVVGEETVELPAIPPPPEGTKTVEPSAPPPPEEPASEAPDEDAGAEDADEDADEGDEDEESAEFFGDGLPDDEPLVRTQDPAPPRSAEAPAEEPAPSFTRPVGEADEVLEKWEPRGDEDRWKEVAQALERAADSASGPDQASLLRSAGRVMRSRLGDPAGAEALLSRASEAAPEDLGVLLDRIAALRAARRATEAAPLLVRASALAEGTTAAELLLQAVEIGREVDPSHALDLARKSTEAAPEDYAAWSALRDLLAETGAPVDQRVTAANKLAGLSTGWAAAEALLEAAGALLSGERVADAVDLLQRAREAAPDHGTVFVVLEDALGDLGDHARLAALYAGEAEREGTQDSGWWWLLAARAHQESGAADEAEVAYGRAVEAGYGLAERERQGAALQRESWEAFVASLRREVDAADGSEKAFAQYRLGQVLERHLSDPDGALAAYRGALEVDPEAGPAADGVARLVASKGDFGELGAIWRARLESSPEGERPAIELRLGEIAEASGDHERAAEHFGKALGSPIRSVELAAAEGVARSLHRAQKWTELGEHWARQATGYDDARQKADLLFRASTVGPRHESDQAAADRLREILALEPSHRGALFELCMRLEAREDWRGLAASLDDAGDASDDASWRSVCKYRASLVRRERNVDPDRIRTGLDSAVEADGAFQPAAWALRDAAADDVETQVALYRSQAETGAGAARGAWAALAAGLLDPQGGRSDLRNLLDREPGHAGATAALECLALAAGDRSTLIGLWEGALSGEPSAEKARAAVRLAATLRETGQSTAASHVLSQLAAIDGDRPLRAAARVAESLGAWDVAASLLEPLDTREDRLQRARVLGRRKGDAAAALPLYQALLDELSEDADVGFGAAITSARAGDYETLARAHQQMARVGTVDAARAASARWAATLHRMGGRHADALACWKLCLELQPDSPQGREGAERELRALEDADGLVELYDGQDDTLGLADALLGAGAGKRAAEVLSAIGEPSLAARLYLEEALFAAEDWQALYDRLTARREVTEDAAEQGRIDGRRRWILAEKLAETDAAWELYRKLHEDAPSDPEVTEALARIAGARGETGMAIQYLKELADSASEGTDAARYQRRVGEVYEANGDPASARQAYLDALDHDPNDAEALDGLRRLAEQEQDWAGLIQVHQREAGIAEPARVLEIKREIARITQEKLEQPAIAMDAWRSVLEASPADQQALERLMGLAETQNEWGSYVEFGTQLAEGSVGSERTALLRKVGVVSQEKLQSDDAIRFFEQAISSATPDAEAARRLEQLYRARGEWGGTIRSLMVQSDIAETPEGKASPLERAAKLELEVRHDRAAAAEFYQRVLDAQPEHEEALRFMASHLFQTKRFDLARSVCDRLEPVVENGQDLDDFDTRMDLAAFYFAYAEMLFEEGNGAGALSRYERALELNPTHQASLQRVGPLYTDAGAWKKAEQVYRQLLQLTGGQGDKGKIATIYSQLGVVERELGNSEKSYKRFNKALELHPNHVGALKGMALVLEDRKDWSNLLNVFNNIIYHATVPADVVAAYMSKGRILDVYMNRPDKAEQHYQRSLDFDPKQPAALLRMSELAMRRDDYAAGLTLAERALALPDEVVASYRPLLHLVVAAGLASEGKAEDADARVGDAKSEGGADLAKELGATPLDDLDALRQLIAGKL